MTTRAGLVSRIALGAVLLLSAVILSVQAAPVPVQASTIQIQPVTAPVPNVHFRQEGLVHLQIHSHLGSTSAGSTIHIHDVHDSSVPGLAKREPGGHPAPPPPHHAPPPPPHHNAPPPPAHHNAPPPPPHHNAPPPPAHHNAPPPPHHNAAPPPHHNAPPPAHHNAPPPAHHNAPPPPHHNAPPPPHHNAAPPPHHNAPPPAHHNAGPPPAHHHESVAAKIRGAFHKVGEGISHAAHAVAHFAQTTGAKIAKVGLKIAATAQKIASKAVGMLPGVGKVLGKAMEGESMGLNKASNAIHANIGGKLGQAMHRMDKAQKVVGYIPRSHIPESFEERVFEDFNEFHERRWGAELEERALGCENTAERGMNDETMFMF